MRHKDNNTEKKIIEFVDMFFDEEKRSPSLREIECGTNISRQTVLRYLKDLANRNVIDYDGKVIITKHISDCLSTPLVKLNVIGNIICGEPRTEEASFQEYIYFPRELLSGGEHFILKAEGNSMINAGIEDQDLVIVRKQSFADVNQIVVALDEENRNTLKRLKYDKNRFYLHAENDEYDDIYPDELKIQGIAVKVIKNLQ